MKKIKLILALGCCFSLYSVARAQTNIFKDTTGFITNLHFVETPPLSELMEAFKVEDIDDITKMTEAKDKVRKGSNPFVKSNPNSLPLEEDPILQKEQGTKSAILPIQNWQGMSGSGYPPDPTGAAGPNHFVQAINTAFRVYNKNGTPAGNQTGLGALLFGVNDGDPIVMYDKMADRWFISQFGVSSNMAYIAISKTSNPLGQYYAYDFQCNVFPDYLKFSIWQDGYYMTANFGSQRVFCFERDAMIAGNPNARAVFKSYNPPKSSGFFCPLTANVDGPLPPAGTPCPLVSYEDDGWFGNFNDQINLYEVAVTWGSVPTMNITLKNEIQVQPFDASYNPGWNDIAQPGTTARLDGIGGVFTFRAQWRKWDGYNSMVFCHGVKANSSTGQFGIRWYEIRQILTSGNWLVHQQGTYAPDGLNRWVGSIAMDDNGNIGMAYAVSGTSGGQSVYPGIRYTGRQPNDPPGLMTIAEQVGFAGTGSQTVTNRFGDYSHTSLDPDGITFWHTGEYLGGSGTNGAPRTRIFSFQIPGVLGLKNEISVGNWNTWSDNNSLFVRADGLKTSGDLHLALYDIQGKLLHEQNTEIVDGAISASVPVSALASGTYLLSASKPMSSMQKVIKVSLSR